MTQPGKIEAVQATIERLARAQSLVVVRYEGLTVAEISDLRGRLRQCGGELKVVKNRLAKRALEAEQCDALDEFLKGPVALAFGYTEPTGPAKVCCEFARKNQKLAIKGGLLRKSRIDAAKVAALAKLPSRPELLGRMAAALMAPARRMAVAMNQAVAKVAYGMKARARQLESPSA